MSRPHFIAAVVVVELDALGGLTVTQLADYAAMRAFARTDPRRLKGTGAPTILSAIEAPMNSPVPLTLTEWDLAFLQRAALCQRRQPHGGKPAPRDEADRPEDSAGRHGKRPMSRPFRAGPRGL